jgi:hypothetical protein
MRTDVDSTGAETNGLCKPGFAVFTVGVVLPIGRATLHLSTSNLFN